MSKTKPKIIRQVFEARYERGYRYLDRCGEVLVILEQLLTETTGKTWLTAEMQPVRASLKCPGLDAVVQIDATRLIVEQRQTDQPIGTLEPIVAPVMATIVNRFDLRKFSRFGCRIMRLLATDSRNQADAMSLEFSPLRDWVPAPDSGWKATSCDYTIVLENPDAFSGVRLQVQSFYAFDAPEAVDQRLLLPSRLLPEGQQEALLSQLRMARTRAQAPLAGLMIDIDYFMEWPSMEDVPRFFKDAASKDEVILASVIRRRA